MPVPGIHVFLFQDDQDVAGTSPAMTKYGMPAEYTPSAKTPDDVEKTPVFDRAGVALKI